MAIDARDIAEAISAMEAARYFMEQNCAVGGGRVDHMISLENAARNLKYGIQGIKIEVKQEQTNEQ